jgi:hypothetical protein
MQNSLVAGFIHTNDPSSRSAGTNIPSKSISMYGPVLSRELFILPSSWPMARMNLPILPLASM